MAKVTFEYVNSAVHPDVYTKGVNSLSDAYENGAVWIAKCLLEAARRNPIEFKTGLDKYRTDPYTDALDELLLPEERKIIGSMTGFMWGFAVQTVAYLLEQEQVPNGAIITVG